MCLRHQAASAQTSLEVRTTPPTRMTPKTRNASLRSRHSLGNLLIDADPAAVVGLDPHALRQLSFGDFPERPAPTCLHTERPTSIRAGLLPTRSWCARPPRCPPSRAAAPSRTPPRPAGPLPAFLVHGGNFVVWHSIAPSIERDTMFPMLWRCHVAA